MVIKSLGFKSIETLSLALNKCGDDVVTVIMFLSTDPLRTLLKFVLMFCSYVSSCLNVWVYACFCDCVCEYGHKIFGEDGNLLHSQDTI